MADTVQHYMDSLLVTTNPDGSVELEFSDINGVGITITAPSWDDLKQNMFDELEQNKEMLSKMRIAGLMRLYPDLTDFQANASAVTKEFTTFDYREATLNFGRALTSKKNP